MKLRNALIFFVVQVFNYSAVAIYTRLVAQAATIPAVTLDAVFAGVNFFIIRRIAKSEEDWMGFLGYTVGAALGTFLGIWTTVRMGH